MSQLKKAKLFIPITILFVVGILFYYALNEREKKPKMEQFALQDAPRLSLSQISDDSSVTEANTPKPRKRAVDDLPDFTAENPLYRLVEENPNTKILFSNKQSPLSLGIAGVVGSIPCHSVFFRDFRG